MRKTIAMLLILTLTLCLGLAACGKKDGGTDGGEKQDSAASQPAETEPAVKGETKTWGVFTVLVPEGYELNGGDLVNPQDPKTFDVREVGAYTSYLRFTASTAEEAASAMETNREFERDSVCEDVTLTTGQTTWTGFSAALEGDDTIRLYLTTGEGDNAIQANISGYAPENETMLAILASVTRTTE